MKIRNGFVSNSSSSSFIILAKGKTSTVRDVAKIMIKDMINELNNNEYWNWLKKLEKIPEDQAVQFFSVNYDTWIIKIADNIFVSTCNNTSWSVPNHTEISKKTKKELKSILKDKYEDFVEYSYDFYLPQYFNNFYSLPYDIKGTESRNKDYSRNYCKKGTHENCGSYTHLWKTSMGNICPLCDAELLRRKEKLEKIEKNLKQENI